MIAGPTPQDAAQTLRDLFQRALACVTSGVVSLQAVPPETDLVVSLSVAAPRGRHSLNLRHRYLLVHEPAGRRAERWRLQTTSYMYKLDDREGREILAYHWHPDGLSHERRPHLHVGVGMGALRPEWQKAHLRTGPVSPSALLVLLIDQLGVSPRRSAWFDDFARLDRALDLS
jgi:hypothetical protein